MRGLLRFVWVFWVDFVLRRLFLLIVCWEDRTRKNSFFAPFFTQRKVPKEGAKEGLSHRPKNKFLGRFLSPSFGNLPFFTQKGKPNLPRPHLRHCGRSSCYRGFLQRRKIVLLILFSTKRAAEIAVKKRAVQKNFPLFLSANPFAKPPSRPCAKRAQARRGASSF